jgi:hypothetical protein
LWTEQNDVDPNSRFDQQPRSDLPGLLANPIGDRFMDLELLDSEIKAALTN